MRTVLSTVTMDGIVVIGEGEKDNAPMLFNGENVGDGTPPLVDVAVDPIDGTTLTAQGRDNALSVIAVSERGSRCSIPARRTTWRRSPSVPTPSARSTSPPRRPRTCAGSPRPSGESVRDLTVVILDRPRHAELIDEVRAERRPDPADQRRRRLRRRSPPARPGAGVDVLIGIGGTPEGVISAAAAQVHGRRDAGPAVARRTTRSGGRSSPPASTSTAVLTTDDLVAATTASSPPPASPTARCSTACASTPAALTRRAS